MQLNVITTPLPGLLIITPAVFEDERGFFYESWNKKDFKLEGIDVDFVQDNHSRSSKGVLRGLHYQNLNAPLSKLVRCTYGEVYDVGVDLRRDSKTFGKWFGTILSAKNKKMLYLPVGFAHGFQTVSDFVELQYKQTNYYSPENEGGIIWNDPDLEIDWPIKNPQLSQKDKVLETFKDYKTHPVFI